MDRFAALQALVGVVEAGGFAPAARRLGLATSSVTRQLDTLEAALGVRLFQRSTRRVNLTAAGQDYYERAVRILADLDEADRAASQETTSPRGILRVSVPVAFARLHIAPVIVKVAHGCPEMQLDIRTTDSMVDLAEERIDLAIRIWGHTDGTLIARRLAAHRRVVCASPAYLERHGVPDTPEDLATHNCLLFAYGHDRHDWYFVGPGGPRRVKVGGRLAAGNSEILREAALGDAGVALLPTWLIGDDVRMGRLRALLTEWTVNPTAEDTAIYAVYLSSRRRSYKLQIFIKYLEEHFGSPPYWDRPA